MHGIMPHFGPTATYRRVLATALVASLFGSAAGGAESSTANAAEKWIKARVASTWPEEVGDRPIKIRIRETTFGTMTKSELSILEAEIAGKPDHPARAKAVNARAIASHGPEVRELLIWTKGPGQLRTSSFNINLHDGTQNITTDAVSTPTDNWQLALGSIAGANLSSLFLSRTGKSVPPAYDFKEGVASRVASVLSDCLAGGLLVGPNATIKDFRVQGDKWSATLAVNSRSLLLTGILDIRHAVPLVERLEVKKAESSESQTKSVEFSGWRNEQALGDRLMVASRVRYRDAQGRILRELELVEFQSVSQDEVNAATKLPVEGEADVVRGILSPMSTTDFRDDMVVRSMADRAAARGKILEELAPSKNYSDRLRWIGGGTLAVLAIVFILIRILRK